MPGDPLSSPNNGELSPFVGSFNTVRTSLDLLRDVRRNQARGVGLGASALNFGDLPPSIRVLVRNDTGADLPPGAVLALNGNVTSIADADNGSYQFRRMPNFAGINPAAITDPFVILEEPAPYVAGGNGPFVRAAVMGVTACDVNITDAAHQYAAPTVADNTKLTSAASGPARILYKPAGTGTLRCVVNMGEVGIAQGAAGISSTAITTDNTWQDLDSFTLPPGTYLLYAYLHGSAQVSAMGGSTELNIIARIYNDTAATDELFSDGAEGAVSLDTATVLAHVTVANIIERGHGTLIVPLSLSEQSVIKLQAYRHTGGGSPTWTSAGVGQNTMSGGFVLGSHWGYLGI